MVKPKRMDFVKEKLMETPMVILKPKEIDLDWLMDSRMDLLMVIPKQMVIDLGWQKD